MESAVTWTSSGRISSERALSAGEKLHIKVIDSQTEAVIETVEFEPSATDLGLYRWPHALARHINATAAHLRAGTQSADGSFTPQFSTYLNTLWTRSTTSSVVLSTACNLAGWADLGEIRSIGSLPTGTSIACRLSSANSEVTYQELTWSMPDSQGGRYAWPVHLSHFINARAGLLRSGEKNQDTKTITPIGSSYRNRLWAPVGLTLRVQREVVMSESTRACAAQIYDTLGARLAGNVPAPEVIDGWLQGFAEGRYQDLVYPPNDKPVSDTTVLATHLERTQRIAAYLFKQAVPSPARYLNSAAQALDFYATQDYQTSNWWERQIGLARRACATGLLLARHLQPHALMNVFVPHAMKNTSTFNHVQSGANLADFASVQISWSLCAWKNGAGDPYLLYLRAAADALSGLCLPVARDGAEHGNGISVDHSISQHNVLRQERYLSQLYAGSYGVVLLSRIFENVTLLNGAFALAEASLKALIDVLVQGIGWMGYARHLDFQVCGRAISRGVNLSPGYSAWVQALLPHADEPGRRALEELTRRASGDESANRHYLGARLYWVNDYLAYLGTGFCCWAKAVSTRTVGCESGNGENLKGYYMGAGTCFLSRDGLEYEGIQPVWDWQRLPGVTAEQVPGFDFPLINWGQNAWGSHDVAGGACDGDNAVLSMELSRGNVTHALKTVIALDNRIYCIGSRINRAPQSHPVITSVNQCKARGEVQYWDYQGNRSVLLEGESITSSNIHQVLHDGLLYIFGVRWMPPSITLQVEKRSGAWSQINTSGSPALVEHKVFSLWINHPEYEDASYLYEVRPADGFDWTQMSRSVKGPDIDVHVIALDNRVLGTFFKPQRPDPGGVGGRIFFPEQPCSYIYAPGDTHFRLTCSDPGQTLETLSFVLAVDEQGLPVRRLEVPLPQGDEKGRSVTGTYPLA
ncbi:polysaccharide lyase family 8 super-sandwich domain-containing protein [Pseudomonas sp. Leaf127]|uniref:polysaccharide lyase family 8 super-sandwich domain-containing protein n=1 Tax=Pseudomonas sp. Leaf127 TaxID=1736267 RepID=UPI000AC3CBAE|nr:polysaccharide lyase family 8 super-sandwich domain-containing protein [Pseudomonas sp. Leaf127]